MTKRRMRLFTLLLIVPFYACGGGDGGSSSPPPPAVTVSISPKSATVAPDKTRQFTATVTGASDTGVIWQVNSMTGGNPKVGTIGTTGLYKAPADVPSPPVVSVIAIAQIDTSKTATAMVTIAQPSGSANQAAQTFPVKLGTSGC